MKKTICLLVVISLIMSNLVLTTSAEENTVHDFSQYNQPDKFSFSMDFDPHQIYYFSEVISQEFVIYGLSENESCTIEVESSHSISHTLDLSKTYTADNNYVSFSIVSSANSVLLDDLNSSQVVSVEIIATTDTGRTYIRKIFIIQSQYGLFLGYITEDYTIDLLYDWLYENGRITAAKYSSLYKTRHTAISEPQNNDISTTHSVTYARPTNPLNTTLKVEYDIIAYDGGERLLVRASLYWTDIEGNEHPARNVEYSLYDADVIGGTSIASGETNNFGYFQCTFTNDMSILENGYDLRISYTARTDSFWVQNVTTDVNAVYEPYSFEVIVGDDISETDYDLASYYYNTTITNAFQIHQAMCVAAEHVKDMEGSAVFNVVEYPGLDMFSCFYFSKLYIGASSFWSWDTIIHEYGHSVASRFGFHSSIPAEHTFEENLIARFSKQRAIKLAWQEGWANYFTYAAQAQQNAQDLSVPYVGDGLYTGVSYNDDTGQVYYWEGGNVECAPSSNVAGGEGKEGSIFRVLWDIMDSSTTNNSQNETFDQLSLGYQSVWNLIIDNAPKTFSEFADCFYSQYPISTTTGRNLGGILGEYGFAATSLTKSGHDATGGCVFFWSKPLEQNNTAYTYYLEFYGASMNLIRSINVTSSSQPYTMSGSEWSSLFGSAQGKIYMCIKVVCNSDPTTGPYFSAFISYPT